MAATSCPECPRLVSVWSPHGVAELTPKRPTLGSQPPLADNMGRAWAVRTGSAGPVPRRVPVLRVPSAHQTKAGPGLVSRPLVLRFMVRGQTPVVCNFHQSRGPRAGGALHFGRPFKISVNRQPGCLRCFPPPRTRTWRGRGLLGRGSFTQSPKRPWGQ